MPEANQLKNIETIKAVEIQKPPTFMEMVKMMNEQSIFRDTYVNFLETKEACENYNFSISFPDDIWRRRQEMFLRTSLSGEAPRPEILSTFLPGKNVRRLLDFGGGSGWLVPFLKSKGIIFDVMDVVETEESITWFSSMNSEIHWIRNKDLQFENIDSSETLFYSNSCIQYLPNLEEFLGQLLKNDWKYLIFEDIPNVEGVDVWSRQQYYGYSTPYHFLNLDKLISIFQGFNYKVIEKHDYLDDFPEKWRYQIATDESVLVPNVPSTLIFEPF